MLTEGDRLPVAVGRQVADIEDGDVGFSRGQPATPARRGAPASSHPSGQDDRSGQCTVCRRSGGFTDDLALLHDTLVAVHEVLHAILAIKPIVGEESQDRIGPSPGPEAVVGTRSTVWPTRKL